MRGVATEDERKQNVQYKNCFELKTTKQRKNKKRNLKE